MISSTLKYKDVAYMLETTVKNLMSILKKRNVILNTNGRNLPTAPYIKRKWFIINHTKIENESFQAVVPVVRVTIKGFYEIEDLFNSEMFTLVECNHALNQIQLEIADFIRSRKINKNQSIITVEDDDKIRVLFQSKSKSELILKFNKKENKLWLPK